MSGEYKIKMEERYLIYVVSSTQFRLLNSCFKILVCYCSKIVFSISKHGCAYPDQQSRPTIYMGTYFYGHGHGVRCSSIWFVSIVLKNSGPELGVSDVEQSRVETTIKIYYSDSAAVRLKLGANNVQWQPVNTHYKTLIYIGITKVSILNYLCT